MATTELGKNTRCANCGRSLYKGERVWVKGGIGKTLTLGLYQTATSGQSHLGKFYCSQGCLDAMTGGGGGGGGAGGGGSAGNAAAKIIEVERAKTQLDAEKDAIQDAKNDNYMSKLRSLTFTGDAQTVATEMEDVYQMWILRNFAGTADNQKAQERLVQEKLEYGLMSLKSLDAVKGQYYEDKINQETARRKNMRKRKIITVIGGVIAVIGMYILLVLFSD